MDFAVLLDDDRKRSRRKKPNAPDPYRRRRWGPWSDVVLELCDGDLDRSSRIVRWPLREALIVYLHRKQAEALEDWRDRRLEWAILAPWTKKGQNKEPKKPEILEV